MSLSIIVMAAGKGTRMKSDLPKVLHPAHGKPIIEYVVETSKQLSPESIVLIVGHMADEVRKATERFDVSCALQQPQLGTGHAVMQAELPLASFKGDILILSGDAPLITRETLSKLLDYHRKENATATVLTAELDDPTGYGRIIRDQKSNDVQRIVEQKDALPEEQRIREINSGIYVFDSTTLFSALKAIDNKNAQQEYYLTDVFAICMQQGKKISAFRTEDPDEIRGINTPEQLSEAESILSGRQ
ncbi:MAG: sugar phosphate nucleotidyltransferase [Prosthecochloris sp.]|uniref:sugar phosphate nucleotidyltransferase n=1 Tax=Prosthecochloris sp. TaxID=290513 RepID=UPI00258EB540|nr:sugar phosphate nucleotidyltransferase [Prosthecochloris sp.]MCW8798020.1 sugar phosphate nucleotidyltransferase [Prosthecochloris sp.]